MNRLVAQAFQPGGLPDFRVRWTRNERLESRPNPHARKPALRTRLGSWSQCAPNMTCRLPMNRSAELQLGAAWRARNAPAWRADFNFGHRIFQSEPPYVSCYRSR